MTHFNHQDPANADKWNALTLAERAEIIAPDTSKRRVVTLRERAAARLKVLGLPELFRAYHSNDVEAFKAACAEATGRASTEKTRAYIREQAEMLRAEGFDRGLHFSVIVRGDDEITDLLFPDEIEKYRSGSRADRWALRNTISARKKTPLGAMIKIIKSAEHGEDITSKITPLIEIAMPRGKTLERLEALAAERGLTSIGAVVAQAKESRLRDEREKTAEHRAKIIGSKRAREAAKRARIKAEKAAEKAALIEAKIKERAEAAALETAENKAKLLSWYSVQRNKALAEEQRLIDRARFHAARSTLKNYKGPSSGLGAALENAEKTAVIDARKAIKLDRLKRLKETKARCVEYATQRAEDMRASAKRYAENGAKKQIVKAVERYAADAQDLLDAVKSAPIEAFDPRSDRGVYVGAPPVGTARLARRVYNEMRGYREEPPPAPEPYVFKETRALVEKWNAIAADAEKVVSIAEKLEKKERSKPAPVFRLTDQELENAVRDRSRNVDELWREARRRGWSRRQMLIFDA